MSDLMDDVILGDKILRMVELLDAKFPEGTDEYKVITRGLKSTMNRAIFAGAMMVIGAELILIAMLIILPLLVGHIS